MYRNRNDPARVVRACPGECQKLRALQHEVLRVCGLICVGFASWAGDLLTELLSTMMKEGRMATDADVHRLLGQPFPPRLTLPWRCPRYGWEIVTRDGAPRCPRCSLRGSVS